MQYWASNFFFEFSSQFPFDLNIELSYEGSRHVTLLFKCIRIYHIKEISWRMHGKIFWVFFQVKQFTLFCKCWLSSQREDTCMNHKLVQCDNKTWLMIRWNQCRLTVSVLQTRIGLISTVIMKCMCMFGVIDILYSVYES